MQQQWDHEAATFDDEPDHGLLDPRTRAAWRELMLGVLPPAPASVADLGCGTGTLARLLVDEGYDVVGLDFSSEMLSRARAKVPEGTFVLGDASEPPLGPAAFDVVLSRHVLWAMPDPAAAFARWVGLLRPDGAVVLVEGKWCTGAGLTTAEAETVARSTGWSTTIRPLRDPALWGREIADERYLLLARAIPLGSG